MNDQRSESGSNRFVCPICASAQPSNLVYSNMQDDRYGCPDVVSIYRCAGCRHHFVNPQYDATRIGNLYETYYGRRKIHENDVRRSANRNLRLSRVARYLLGTGNSGQFYAPTGATLLDVGSGPCQDLLEAVDLGHDAVGVEVDRVSQELGGRLGLTVISQVAEIANRYGKSFDWIQLNQVVEHAIDPSQLLVDLKQLMVKGSRIFIATPNVDSVFRKLFRRRWIHWHVPFHQHHFSKPSLIRLLNQNGFEIERIFFRTPTVWTVLQFKALARGDLFAATSAEGVDYPGTRISILRLTKRVGNLMIWTASCLLARFSDLSRQGDCICVIARSRE